MKNHRTASALRRIARLVRARGHALAPMQAHANPHANRVAPAGDARSA